MDLQIVDPEPDDDAQEVMDKTDPALDPAHRAREFDVRSLHGPPSKFQNPAPVIEADISVRFDGERHMACGGVLKRTLAPRVRPDSE